MVEIGKVYAGKVKGITNYGAFVEILQDGEAPVSGMVHISEVANTFVNDIHEFLKEGQDVRVLVIGINEQNKISLSIRKALPQEERPRNRTPRNRANVWEPRPQKPDSELSFEEMMNKYKSSSEERMGDIRRNTDRKHKSRRRGN